MRKRAHLKASPSSVPPQRLSDTSSTARSRSMPAELLPELLLLPLPVLPHPPVQVGIEVTRRRATVLLDGRNDGLLVGVTEVALDVGVAKGDEGFEGALEEVGLGEGVDIGG